jgi:hypothetical protein
MFQNYPNLPIQADREDLKIYLYKELDQGGIYDIADQEFVRGLVRRLVDGAEGMYVSLSFPMPLFSSSLFDMTISY